MDIEELKRRLAGKLDSKDKFDQLLIDYQGFTISDGCNWWAAREELRIYYGVYTPIPDSVGRVLRCYTPYRYTIPYMSIKQPGLWGYTENGEKGERDIQSIAKPGRFMKRFFGDYLSDEEIRDLAVRGTPPRPESLKFAQTADEIERVYMNGPRSCMSAENSHLIYSPIHPSRVYATVDPPIQVAYLEEGGRITARGIVDKDKKLFLGSMYGDTQRLSEILKMQGFTADSRMLDGRTVDLIWVEEFGHDAIVMPYVDGDVNYLELCEDRDDRAVFSDTGHWHVKQYDNHPCGIVGYDYNPGSRETCDLCGAGVGLDHLNTVQEVGYTSQWCDSCAETSVIVNGCFHTEESARDQGYEQCSNCGAWEHRDDMEEVRTEVSETHIYCGTCCNINTIVCAEDGTRFISLAAAHSHGYEECPACGDLVDSIWEDRNGAPMCEYCVEHREEA